MIGIVENGRLVKGKGARHAIYGTLRGKTAHVGRVNVWCRASRGTIGMRRLLVDRSYPLHDSEQL